MKKSFLFVIISTLLFSSMEVAIKLVNGVFNPIELNFLRFLIGGIVLLPLAIMAMKKQGITFTKRSFAICALTGFLCIILSMTCFQLAIGATKASIVAVLFSCNPVFALFFAVLLLKEKLAKSEIISCVLSVIGLLVIINPFHMDGSPLGISLSLISALLFGLYSIVSRWGSLQTKLNGVSMTCFTFLFGSLELLILMLFTHIPAIASFESTIGVPETFISIPVLQGVDHVLSLIYLGVFVTGCGFATYFIVMELAGVSTASLVFFLKPAIAPVIALFVLGESIPLLTIIGIVIILIGSAINFIGAKDVESQSMMKGHKDLESVHDFIEPAEGAESTGHHQEQH